MYLLLSPSIVDALELCTAENAKAWGLACGDQCLEEAWVNLPLLLVVGGGGQLVMKKSALGGAPFWRLAMTEKPKKDTLIIKDVDKVDKFLDQEAHFLS